MPAVAKRKSVASFRSCSGISIASLNVEPHGQSPVQGQAASRSQRLAAPPPEPPHSDEHHRHCTAGEIASELGYSVSYILAVKKAMYSELATLPRRLDPKEVSDWIYAHPAFRMRDVYDCHPKASPEPKECESH